MNGDEFRLAPGENLLCFFSFSFFPWGKKNRKERKEKLREGGVSSGRDENNDDSKTQTGKILFWTPQDQNHYLEYTWDFAKYLLMK